VAHVAVRNVAKRYGSDVVAVENFSLEVADGEFLVMVGPSGCGKTTILRCIAGLETFEQGEIEIDGRVVNRVQAKNRNIAMVFQNYALYPHMTVRGNLAFGL
jgi:ABC-type sugar transport system ATPase subunit